MAGFASALAAAIEDRKHHTREIERLRSLAPSITTAAMKARVLKEVQEHASLAGFIGEGKRAEWVVGYVERPRVRCRSHSADV